MTAPDTDDFTLLHNSSRPLHDRSRRTVLWMMGLAVLVVSAVLALFWYLNNFETEEEERRRGADAQWLEQSVQFHFRRLEDDAARLAAQAALDSTSALPAFGQGAASQAPLGLLWREPGVIQAQVWRSTQGTDVGDLAAWRQDWQAQPANAQALQALLDITSGLRRAHYAGPMRSADGQASDRIWLAQPYFDGSRHRGTLLVALSMRQALDALLPGWFTQNQTVRLVVDGSSPAPQDSGPYRMVMNLPGTDLLLEVVPQGPQSSQVPRLFFVVALLFLLGMLASLLALRRDIGKRQQVQQRLQAEVALRTAMEHSVSIGMRAWDMRGRILYVNDAFCALVGWSATELLGRSAPMPYWPQELQQELLLQHHQVIRHGTPRQGLETQFQHRDGHLVDVLIHEAPLLAADGRQLGWMSSVLDISERKRAQQLAAQQQEKLEASGRLVAVGEVASTLAHELNQPLGALASFANGLLNRLHSGSIGLAEMEPVVQRMAQLANRAGGVIQRVNAFARRRELQLSQLNLSALVRRVGASVQEQQETQPTPVALQLQLPPADLWVQGDALLLEQLVHNLCSNALAWAVRGPGPAARVALRLASATCTAPDCDAAPCIALAVADSGPGVPEDALARLFDAFYTTQAGGMGMGLAICRSITEAHHGRIVVGRDPVLGGALFTVQLPLAPAPSTP